MENGDFQVEPTKKFGEHISKFGQQISGYFGQHIFEDKNPKFGLMVTSKIHLL